jgi:hypothetical protein
MMVSGSPVGYGRSAALLRRSQAEKTVRSVVEPLQRPAAQQRDDTGRADPPRRFGVRRIIDREGEATLTALAMVSFVVWEGVAVVALVIIALGGDKAQRGAGREVGDHETPSPGASGRGSVGCPGQRLEVNPTRNLARLPNVCSFAL